MSDFYWTIIKRTPDNDIVVISVVIWTQISMCELRAVDSVDSVLVFFKLERFLIMQKCMYYLL